jgi:ribosomal protein S18 acetylase RimI-like enzyme
MTTMLVRDDPDLAACLELHNTVLPTNALYQLEIERLQSGRPDALYARWFGVEVDGVLAGCAWTGTLLGAIVGVAVAERFRGRGIGTTLARAVMVASATEGDVWAFRVEPGDPAAQRLLARHGFERVPDTGGARWVGPPLTPDDAGPVGPLELVTDAHVGDPAQLEQLRRVISIANEDVPGADPATADEVRFDHEVRQRGGGFALLARDDTGTIVGAVTAAAAPWSSILASEHTLVDHAHRGQGLGRRLKQAQHAEAARRGFTRVVTDVRPDNAPMIAVLRRLGYEQEDRPSYVRRANAASSGR